MLPRIETCGCLFAEGESALSLAALRQHQFGSYMGGELSPTKDLDREFLLTYLSYLLSQVHGCMGCLGAYARARDGCFNVCMYVCMHVCRVAERTKLII